MGQHMLFSLVVTLTLTSFSASLTYLSREPGWVRSRVSKNLGDYKQTIGGGGRQINVRLSLQSADGK